ncbi:MAG: DUF192 domain-containing protein [Polyangiales bacterium]
MRPHWIVLAALVASCRQQPAPPEISSEPPPRPQQAAIVGPAVVLHTRGGARVPVQVEVARTDPQRMRGLMYRREMAETAGMIFLFPGESHQTFWMRNTLIPLDMIFIKADRTILGIYRNAVPETDDPREVPGDSQYVLEVNGGFCQRHNVNAGDRVEFVDIPAPLPE